MAGLSLGAQHAFFSEDFGGISAFQKLNRGTPGQPYSMTSSAFPRLS